MEVTVGQIAFDVLVLLYFPLLLSWGVKIMIEILNGLTLKTLGIQIRRAVATLFFPGIVAHELMHAFAARAVGLQVNPYGTLAFGVEDRWGGTIRNLRSMRQAFIIAYAPMLLLPLWVVLVALHNLVFSLFAAVGVTWLILGYWWLLISLLVFGYPSPKDLALPWTTAVIAYPKTTVTLSVAAFCSLIAIPVWGWIVPLTNLSIFTAVVLAQRIETDQRPDHYKKDGSAEDKDKNDYEDIEPTLHVIENPGYASLQKPTDAEVASQEEEELEFEVF